MCFIVNHEAAAKRSAFLEVYFLPFELYSFVQGVKADELKKRDSAVPVKLPEVKLNHPPSEWSHGSCQSDALEIFSEQHEQVVSLLSIQHTVIAHLDLGYIRLSSLYLAGEGSHLRCSINDAVLWMTHVDTKAMERFPTAAATLDINSRLHAGNMAESQTGPHVWRLHLYLKSVAPVSSQEQADRGELSF